MKASPGPVRQLGLFPLEELGHNARAVPIAAPTLAAQNPRLHALAAAMPQHLRFGTSSWTFPGWDGVVYTGNCQVSQLKRGGVGGGLVAYAQNPLLRSVGLDRSYYAPISREDFADYIQLLPADFRFASKIWSDLTTYRFPQHPRYGARAGELNPHFLAPGLGRSICEEFHSGLGAHTGPVMFEFPPMPRGCLREPDFLALLANCLGPIANVVPIAVELRNRELLTINYAHCLRELRVAPVLNFWSATPSLAEQRRRLGPFTTPHAVVRLLLPPGLRYADQKRDFSPFNRIAQPQPEMRADTLAIIEQSIDEGVHDLYVLVNNKAEGCAPLTIQALAEEVATRTQRLAIPTMRPHEVK
jgi:uncharacterized protein YecE (DUF72 family)